MIWRLEAKAFSRPLVNLLDDLSNVFITQIINVFSLWDILPDQAIGVFVEPPFPGMIGVCEEALGSQLTGDLFMVSKFSAIVVGSIRISYAHCLTGRIPAAAASTARGVGCLGRTAR